MLLITVELLPLGGEEGRKTLGEMKVTNTGGSAAYGNYLIEVSERSGTPRWTGQLTDYARHAGSVWDLVARGILVAMGGREALPPRPVHAWRREGSQD